MDQVSIEEIIKKLESLGSLKRIGFMTTNVPTSMRVLGVSAVDMRKVIHEINTEKKSLGPEIFFEFAVQLIQTDILECQVMAYEMIGKNKKVMEWLNEEKMHELTGTMDNWGSVDSFCVLISGVLWNMGKVKDETILKWVKSENVWERRMAVVSTISLNMKAHGGKGDAKRTLMICEKVVNDKNDMVVKALSWALRALYSSGKHSEVIEFLNKYEAIIHSRVKREVWTKIKTGRKN